MDWDKVKEDTYYKCRKLESDARNDVDPDKWEEYADIKSIKGSYILGIYGYMNAASLLEIKKEIDEAISYYKKAFKIAVKVKYKELVVILGYKMAQLYEQEKKWAECISIYEEVAEFCDIPNYTKPIDLWKRNITHWEEEDHIHDAVWSREHIELYKKLFGIKK